MDQAGRNNKTGKPMRSVIVKCVELPHGQWRIQGLPEKSGTSRTYVSRERALEDALETIGPLESWQLVVINTRGEEVGFFNSADDAMHWHVS